MKRVFGRTLDVDAILTTHAHGDHIGKLAVCARSFGARVYLTEATRRRVAALPEVSTSVYGCTTPFDIGSIRVEPMSVPHDAPQVALVFAHGAARAALVTNLGEAPARLPEHLSGCQLVLLESNHDPEMLRKGPYPPFLQRRVGSRLGHLSNEQAADVIRRLGPDTTDVVLMHISQRNNTPLLALTAARAAAKGRSLRLKTAHQDSPLDLAVRVPASRSHEAQLALPL